MSPQQGPARVLELRRLPCGSQTPALGTPHLVHRLIPVHRNVEAVQHVQGLSGLGSNDLLVGLPHVTAHKAQCLDRLRPQRLQPPPRRVAQPVLDAPQRHMLPSIQQSMGDPSRTRAGGNSPPPAGTTTTARATGFCYWTLQKIARGLNRDPVPPGSRKGAAITKNSQRPSASQIRTSSSSCKLSAQAIPMAAIWRA